MNNRGGGAQSKQHPPSAAIAAFSVEAYSTLEAESRAHLAAVAAAAAFQRRRDDDEGGEEGNNEGDDDGEAAATAAEVRE